MYDREDELFGHDGRHKPNPFPRLLTGEGWACSHNRLAYSQMNRQQDANMSEYAISTIGMLPKGYVIINEDAIDFDPDTAFRVAKHRVAIPIKELARERWLTIHEQWELMNPRYIGTYNRSDFNCCKSKRPDFDDAYQEAVVKGKTEQFFSQFWTPEYEHKAAIHRLRIRLDELDDQRMKLKTRMIRQQGEVKRIKRDIAYQRSHLYEGNIQQALWKAEERLRNTTHEFYELLEKIDKIKQYLKNYTFTRNENYTFK